MKLLANKFSLISSINIESVIKQIQIGIEIECKWNLKAKFNIVCMPEYYIYLSLKILKNLHKKLFPCLKVLIIMCNYLQLWNEKKSPVRYRIADIYLGSVLKVITENPDFSRSS